MNRNTIVDPSTRQLGEKPRKSDFFNIFEPLTVCLFGVYRPTREFFTQERLETTKETMILFQRFRRCPCMQVFFVIKTEEISTAFEISWFLIITWNYAWFRILRIDCCSASSSLLCIVYLNWRSGLLSNYLLIHTVIVFSSQRSS